MALPLNGGWKDCGLPAGEHPACQPRGDCRGASDERVPGEIDLRVLEHRDHREKPGNEPDVRVELAGPLEEKAEEKGPQQTAVGDGHDLQPDLDDRVAGVGEEHRSPDQHEPPEEGEYAGPPKLPGPSSRRPLRRHPEEVDRKSTCLNSSHIT